jgi:peptide deformylase
VNERRTVGRGGAALKGRFSGLFSSIDRLPASPYIARMALRDIVIIPDPRLRLKSEPVKDIDKGIRALVDDMFETMYAAPGIGLAAIQIGVPQRVVTMDLAKKDDEKEPQVFINPEIVWMSEEKSIYDEGCLSIPEYYEEVERPQKVKVKYLDLDGKAHEIEADGLLATCLQHEIDHLNGVLFIDHLSKLKRDMVMKKFKKAAKRGEPAKFADDKEPSHHIG